ncbi:unnamed protein product [Diamesa tonsa]
MTENRKRPRTAEDSFRTQAKQYIVQKRLDVNNPATMRQVFNKTLAILYAGCLKDKKIEDDKNNGNNMDVDNAEVNVNGGNIAEGNQVVPEQPPEAAGCSLCIKQMNEGVQTCKNCNLKICMDCRIFCSGCDDDLCVNCVNIL